MAQSSSVTIGSGSTTSDETPVLGSLIGVVMPATFTGTAISFLGSADGITYQPVYNDGGTQVSVPVAASRAIGLDTYALALSSWAYLKVVSNASEGGARTIQFCFKA